MKKVIDGVYYDIQVSQEVGRNSIGCKEILYRTQEGAFFLFIKDYIAPVSKEFSERWLRVIDSVRDIMSDGVRKKHGLLTEKEMEAEALRNSLPKKKIYPWCLPKKY